MPPKSIEDKQVCPASKKKNGRRLLQMSSEMTEITNNGIEELLAGMRKASKELLSTPDEAKKYLLSTGFYTKSLKLKRRFL